jgi:hypothetical protein
MPAQFKDGRVVIARDSRSDQCTAETRDGRRCGRWALRGSDKCYLHSLTPAERSAFGRQGSLARSQRARERRAIRDATGHKAFASGENVQRAAEVTRELLDSESPETQALGVLALTALFRLRPDQRDGILIVLGRVRPELVDPNGTIVSDLDKTRARLRRLYEEGRISLNELPPGVLDPILETIKE